MRVAVVGAGAVGGLVGGFLARSGVQVAFVARGRHLVALRERGLRVESPRASFHLATVEAAEDPAALAPAEVVLIAVKGWQVPEVAARIAPLVAEGGFVVPLENGVEAPDVVAKVLGEERVLGGVCHLAAWLEAPGVVRHTGDLFRVTVGELPGGTSPRAEALAGALRAAQVDAAVAEDIQAVMWEKFLFIAAFGAVGAVARAPVGAVRAIPETRSLLSAAMEEIAAVARARGVRISGAAVQRALSIVDGFPPSVTASMQRDIQGGRPSELHDQTGAVVRLGRQAGVAVPVNEMLLAALLPQEQAARRPSGA
jgi:2-dehydropantoate 2-reductase